MRGDGKVANGRAKRWCKKKGGGIFVRFAIEIRAKIFAEICNYKS